MHNLVSAESFELEKSFGEVYVENQLSLARV